ncbi:MAG: type I restriction-modification system endonuclease [Thiolinea sp.]
MEQHTSNFFFLQEHSPVFWQLARTAEAVFASDPNTTLIKLRQLGEAMAQDMAARYGILFDDNTTQADLLFRLDREVQLEPAIRQLFHTLRIEGNNATHRFQTRHKEAMDGLKVARELAIWFHRSFGKQDSHFKPGAFIPPTDPSQQLRDLQGQIGQLRTQLLTANEQVDSNHQLLALLQQEKTEADALAEAMDEEARRFQQQAQQYEAELLKQQQAFEQHIKTLQAELTTAQQAKTNTQHLQTLGRRIRQASKQVTLDEDLTRIIIDQQLQEAGWEADSQVLHYAQGTRPEKGKNKAIAEWPTTGKQRADYVLFTGLTPIAVVEAKRENTNVAGKITQAERYARGFRVEAAMQAAWEQEGRNIAWADEGEGHYQIPFVYSCNGRPFIQQLKEQSGTWFRDVRSPANTARALQQFHTPDGLLDRLKRSHEQAQQLLQQEGFAYLKLRNYQEKAIQATERALQNNQQHCLLAMATGTGKTRTIIGLMYRFLKTEHFRRILFLVDRTALGDQAQDAFNEAPLEQNQTLSKIYNIAELGDMQAEAETRIQVATVQAMVMRIFQSDTPPPVDQFDCIIIDEAHRGYTLDQEMTEGELSTRAASQYLSSYRRVDDWLIDHEPPIRYTTLLSQNGIKFEKGETVSRLNTRDGTVDTAELEDDTGFKVEAFNKRVITEKFNKVICDQLAKELDPFGLEKTLIFCATDLHADMVKRLLDEAFKAVYEDDYNEAAVRKITGQSDKVRQLIRQYKNERYPNIAITVDLLTTGIDVEEIAHLVFMRRVSSRILYEQMIGRATRRCDEIGKTVFKIYDPVDIYASLQDVSTMKPLVKDPNITLEQLYGELTDSSSLEQALATAGEQTNTSHADDVLNQLNQKIMRVMRKAAQKAERKPALKTKLDELENLWGVAPDKLHQH